MPRQASLMSGRCTGKGALLHTTPASTTSFREPSARQRQFCSAPPSRGIQRCKEPSLRTPSSSPPTELDPCPTPQSGRSSPSKLTTTLLLDPRFSRSNFREPYEL